MHLQMTALVLDSAEGGSFENRHNHLDGRHILATVAHNVDILALRRRFVAKCVSCQMESADRTAERLEMTAVKVGNHSLAADDIDWFVSHIDHLCLWQFMKYCLMLQNSLPGVVACQIGHPVESYSLSAVEIRLLT